MKCIQLSLALALATLAAAAVLAPTAQATFRCNGSADLCDRPFNEVVFPSTHNSMAADNYGWSSLVTTQTWSIRDQLRLGIRALAIDVWYAREGGAIDIGYGDVDNDVAGPTRPGVEPYLCHGQCQLGSKRLEDGFAEVLSFLQESPREVVLIYVEDYVSPEDMKTVVEDSGLWPYVHTGPQTATLRQLIDSGKRLVFVSQNKTTGGDWYPYLRNIGRDTGYAFDDTADFTTPGGQVASCAPNPDNTTGSGRLFVMQHFITDPIASRADSQVVNQPDVIVTRALRCRDVRGVMPSVLMVDYNELGDVNRAARMLNDMYVDPEPGPGGGSDGGGSGAGTGGGNTGGGGDTAKGAKKLEMLTLSARTNRVRRGGTRALTVRLFNTGDAATTEQVDLLASNNRGFRVPRSVQLRVPANGFAERTVTVRASRRATGKFHVTARLDRLESRLTLRPR